MKMRKGACVPFPEKLCEGYARQAHSIIANVGADKLLDLFKSFILAHDEPLFFILELPINRSYEIGIRSGVNEGLHKDIYYIDGCAQTEAMGIIEPASYTHLEGAPVEDGQLALVAFKDGRTLVRRLERKNGWVLLIAENGAYETLMVRPRDVEILGRVTHALLPLGREKGKKSEH